MLLMDRLNVNVIKEMILKGQLKKRLVIVFALQFRYKRHRNKIT